MNSILSKVINKKILIFILVIGSLLIYSNYTMAAIQTTTRNVNGTTLTVTYDDLSVSGVLFDDADPTDNIITVQAVAKGGFGFYAWETAGGATINEYTTAEVDVDVTQYTDISAIFKKMYVLNTSTSGNGIINKSPNKAQYLKGEEVTLTATPLEGYEFDSWTGDIATGQGDSQSITVTMDSDKDITANFVQGSITSFEIGPSHIVRQTDIREFEFRPEAVKEGQEVPDDVTISFQFSANASKVYVVRKNGELIAESSAGSTNDGINYAVVNEKIILTTNFLTSLEKDTYFEIRLGNQTSGPVLATFTIKDSYARPKIEVSIDGHPQYGILESGKVYYLKEKANLEVDVTAQSDIISQRYIRGYSSDSNPKSLDRKVELSGFDWKVINDNSNISEELNVNITDENWIIEDVSPLSSAVNDLDGGEIEVIAVRMKAYATGARTHADETYYFAIDSENPDAGPGTNPNYDADILFDVQNTSKPQLKVKIHDGISGIDSSTIEAKAIKVDDNANLEDLITTRYGTNAWTNSIFDQNADVYFELINYNTTTEVATLSPRIDLQEGQYVVRITAEDKAGNGQANADDVGFTFGLKINESAPIINNVRLGGEVFNTSNVEFGNVVSSGNTSLEFNIYNSEEVRYQIRARDKAGELWTVLGDPTQDYDKKYYFINEALTDLEDGIYEIIIVADDIGIDPEIINLIDNIDTNLNMDIQKNVQNQINSVLDNSGKEFDEERTVVRAFRFRVDGQAPVISSEIKYYNVSDGTTTDPDANNSFGKIVTGLPAFQFTISDISDINEIKQIEFIKDGETQGISGGMINTLKPDDPDATEKTYTIRVKPNTTLSEGWYTLKIQVADEWGEKVAERSFPQLFNVDYSVEDIQFNLEQKNSVLSINESSTIVVNFLREINYDTLSLDINSTELIVDGEQTAESKRDFYIKLPAEGSREDAETKIIIFAKKPLSDANNTLTVTVKDSLGSELSKSLEFTVERERKGFGFGRLLIN